MASPLDDWDLERYRAILRERASRLRRDPRIRVRFDESDLTNETLLNAVKVDHLPTELASDERRLAWLAVIQDNTLIDLHRKQFAAKRDVRRERDMQSLQKALRESSINEARLAVDPSASPAEQAQQREIERLTEDAINQLDSPQRDILRLRRQGCTLEEIANALGLTLPSVAGYYYRALKKLKDQLKPQ